MTAKKVLITGISGLVGSSVYLYLKQWPERYELYGLDGRRELSERIFDDRGIDLPEDRFFLCDIADMDRVQRAVQGMEVVVHLAADPSGRTWESLLHSNIIGAYNVFEASRKARVKRLVAASTIQVSSGDAEQEPYRSMVEGRLAKLPADFAPVSPATPAQPRNLYAASKVWNESLAQVYAHSHGLSCLCIRIGWVVGDDRPPNNRGDIWCSQRDIAELFRCCVEAPAELRFDIFYGMSDNRRLWVDIEKARERVGYAPRDQAENRP
jgi:nucleoside-diphosphate-sugar epimerase